MSQVIIRTMEGAILADRIHLTDAFRCLSTGQDLVFTRRVQNPNDRDSWSHQVIYAKIISIRHSIQQINYGPQQACKREEDHVMTIVVHEGGGY